ncbi:MAG: hypothetical protein ABFD79_02895, partial [Phycisphaerales bacterium]
MGKVTQYSKPHALLWNGTSQSCIDLNPVSGFSASAAYATDGAHQVGYGQDSLTNGNYEALMWNSSASDYVNLNPSGMSYSVAYGISGNHQFGYGYGPVSGWQEHALLWSGTAENCIDLNPAGYLESYGHGICGNQQVGFGKISMGDGLHALLWSGTAESYVDLHPGGIYEDSAALATNGIQQVGYGEVSDIDFRHALVWNGSTDNFKDLHHFLPQGFYQSEAFSIDNFGNVTGYATDNTGYTHAILWKPVPEPMTICLFSFGALLIRKRKYSTYYS